jgi:type IV pilus assembly protein PilW
LIELIIALGVFSIVSLAAFSVLSSSQRTAVMNDQTVQVQSNVRLAMDLISRDLRLAGFGNPAAGSMAGCASHVNPTDNAVGADAGSDSISIMTVDQQIGTLAAAYSSGAQITVTGLSSDIAVGQVITLEGILTATVNAVNTGTGQLTLSKSVSAPQVFPAGMPVLRLTCVAYTVTGIGASPPFQLLRNGVGIVDGIESLQLAYGVDADNNGTIDDQPGGIANTVDCLDFVPNNGACTQGTTTYAAGTGTVTTLPASITGTPTSARQIRVTVVGRAIPPAAANVANNTWSDPSYTSSSAVTAEDQVIASASGIRRRTLTRVVSLRNAYTL